MKRLYDKLCAYSESDYYGFHMPGHKRNENVTDVELPYKIDITEIDGFDDLNHPHDILLESQMQAAKLYGAEETRFLVNGSTVGLLASIMAVTDRGDEILVARNCHKSVYHAMELQGLHPVYLYPAFVHKTGESGDISADSVDNLLKSHPNVCAVVITSPTYEGVVSDVEAIARVVHAREIPLIVDEAHGAHFGMHPYFPQNSNAKGADLVIHSLHKTMPSLTQTALLHINGDLVCVREVDRYLRMLQTSSPSYVLLASIDACIQKVMESGEAYFIRYVKMLDRARKELQNLKYIQLSENGQDKSKILLSVKGTPLNGRELCELLREQYHLELEMAAGSYALAMTGPGDIKEGMDRLVKALQEIDHELQSSMDSVMNAEGVNVEPKPTTFPRTELIYTSAEMCHMMKKGAKSRHKKVLPWVESVGYISTEYAYLYPPGIPILVPGEQISTEAVKLLKMYESQGFQVEGLENQGEIGVWICE